MRDRDVEYEYLEKRDSGKREGQLEVQVQELERFIALVKKDNALLDAYVKEARIALRKRKFERDLKLESLQKSYRDETRRNYQASQEYQAILSTMEPKTSRQLRPLTNKDLIVIEEEKSPKHASTSRRASTVMRPL
jgi:hypothetical protein